MLVTWPQGSGVLGMACTNDPDTNEFVPLDSRHSSFLKSCKFTTFC